MDPQGFYMDLPAHCQPCYQKRDYFQKDYCHYRRNRIRDFEPGGEKYYCNSINSLHTLRPNLRYR